MASNVYPETLSKQIEYEGLTAEIEEMERYISQIKVAMPSLTTQRLKSLMSQRLKLLEMKLLWSKAARYILARGLTGRQMRPFRSMGKPKCQ